LPTPPFGIWQRGQQKVVPRFGGIQHFRISCSVSRDSAIVVA
jgi:hypothetical protein